MSGAVAPGPHVTEWAVRLRVTEDGDLTRAHAALDTGTGLIETDAEARRSPLDPSDPAIGDELAAGRALMDLGHRLLRAGSVAAEAADTARSRDGQ
ncbi:MULTISPECIES: dsRBD fold-containing protein [Kitasatospora]|uniref:DUF1876 domain-containing protein n=2 Tax=Kitasatospora TaxID=2063 RepID=A0ABT1J1F2_9ACTN|nr:dsRBD fold-containing protein [Kitasatospora paracochleata]MCP2311260.1 hypothetical protein [Kitasatospora paracochleata]